jgi:protein phosphatase
MRIRPGIELGSLTDVGCQRDNNEDAFTYWEPEGEDQFLRKGRLAVIADGMGGYEGGQEASRLAVETVLETYRTAPDSDPQAALIGSLRTAHERIRQYAETHPQLYGMGTTCTAMALSGKDLYFAHVGDSRLYLIREAQFNRLTKDHSYVGRLVESGVLSAQEAEGHPQRHILTAALGAGGDVVPDFPEQPVALQPGDSLLLCTDGLWSMLTEDELHQAIRVHAPAEACRELVQLARDRGGPDNITLQILRLTQNGRN